MNVKINHLEESITQLSTTLVKLDRLIVELADTPQCQALENISSQLASQIIVVTESLLDLACE